ncbi:hypothetical protein, partial [Stomatohabitans albus]|uniref:hypothetical protein n=1 Tax=Stomatohabitans albus TaxID=3110766 RepID=UPI00300C22D2
VVAQARRLNRDPEEIAKVMFAQENVGALVTDALRRKAIDFLMDAVTITNEPPAIESEEPADETPVAVDDAPEGGESEPAKEDPTPDNEGDNA